MDARITRDTRKFELRDAQGNVVETDLWILTAKDRQNQLWHTIKTTIHPIENTEKK